MSLSAVFDPRRSLRARFAAVMGGCGLAFALAAALLVGAHEQAQVQKVVGDALRRESELLGRTLNIALQERLLMVRQLASQPVLSSGLMARGDTRLLLEQLRSQHAELAWLAVTDATGRVQVATGNLLEGQRLNAEPWFAEGLKQPWVGERRAAGMLGASVPLTRDGQEAFFVDLAAPLINFEGRTLGVVVARLSWTWLDDLNRSLYADGHRPPGTDSLVLDRLGRVAIGPDALLGRALAVPGLQPMLEGGAPQVLTWPDGTRYLTALSRDTGANGPSARLTVVMRQQEAVAFAEVVQLRQRLVVSGLLSALGFMALSVWLAGRVTRPVKALSEAAARSSNGQPLDLPPVPAQRQDEVADLGRAVRTLHSNLLQQLVEQRRATDRFEGLFNGAPVAIFIDAGDGMTMANAACLQLFGARELAQLTGKQAQELIHPDDHERLRRDIAANQAVLMRGEATTPVEYRFVRLDGSVRNVELTALRLELDGKPSVHVALRDITEQKRDVAALAESEARLQLVLRGTGAAIWDWTLGSQAVYLSPTWSALLDLPEGQLPVGRAQWEARVHADDRAMVRDQFDQLVSGRVDRIDTEFRIHGGVGITRSLLLRAFLVRDEQQRPARLVGSASDITEIREARRLLQEREAMLARTSRMAQVGGWSIEVPSLLTDWTAELARMHELAESSTPTQALMRSVFTAEDWARMEVLARRAVRTGEPYELEVLNTLPSGRQIWVLVTGQAVRQQGRTVRLEGTMQNVTDRRLAEDAVRELNAQLEARVLARTAQLRAANAELDSFAYAVSHDLRAPLRAMSGFSQALQEDHGALLDGEARLFLDQIIQASQRMGELIDGLLALSRCTRGELRSDEVDISVLANRALAELRSAEPAREVAVQIEPGLQVHGDARMMDAVMRNLVGNAWKYTGRCAAPLIRVRQVLQDGLRWIEVSDNGAGFDMAHAGRLFKAFARLHRQDEFTGIGIGLATVQRIVLRHGGRIEAEGQPGQGAVFRFHLPAQGVAKPDTLEPAKDAGHRTDTHAKGVAPPDQPAALNQESTTP